MARLVMFVALIALATDSGLVFAQAVPPGGVTLPNEWSQSDETWADDIVLGTNTWKMRDYGCMITAAAVLLRFYGLDLVPDPNTQGNPLVSLTPGTLNKFLKASHPGTGSLNWGTLLEKANSGEISHSTVGPPVPLQIRTWKPGDQDYCCNSGIDRCELDYLKYYLGLRYPVHVRVNGRSDPTKCCGHSLIVRQYVGIPLSTSWELYYSDPGLSIPQNGPVSRVAWRQVRPLVPSSTPSPFSEIVFDAGTPVLDRGDAILASPPTLLAVNALGTDRVLIVDPLGRRAGTDSAGTSHSEIPGSAPVEGEYNDPDPPSDFSPSPVTNVLNETLQTGTWISTPTPGIYGIRVWGDSEALVTLNAYGASTSTARTFTGGSTTGRTYSYSLPSDVGTTTLVPGDRAMLSQRLLIPVPPNGSQVFVGDIGLAAGLYSDRPAIHGLDANRGALGFVLGNVVDVGGEAQIQALQLYNAWPSDGNHAPVAAWDNASVPSGTTLNLPASTVLANDTDPDLDAISVTAVGQAPDTHGSVNLDGSGIHYTPNPGYSGQARFVYEVRDPSGRYGAAGVTVDVTPSTGVGDESTGLAVYLQSWPRPTRDVLHVRCRLVGEGPATLTLADVVGRTVARRTLSGSGLHTEQLDEVARLAAGVYVLQLEEGGRIVTDRVVVVK